MMIDDVGVFIELLNCMHLFKSGDGYDSIGLVTDGPDNCFISCSKCQSVRPVLFSSLSPECRIVQNIWQM
jgi:hypothetical protein